MISAYATLVGWCDVNRLEDWECKGGTSHDWLRPERPPAMNREVLLLEFARERPESHEVRRKLLSAVDDAAINPVELRGVPPSHATIEHARRFASVIPVSVPLPDVSVYPGGDISFEWQEDRSRVFTVLVDGQGRLHYAGLFGDSDVHGTERCANGLPASILAGIQRVLGEDFDRSTR